MRAAVHGYVVFFKKERCSGLESVASHRHGAVEQDNRLSLLHKTKRLQSAHTILLRWYLVWFLLAIVIKVKIVRRVRVNASVACQAHTTHQLKRAHTQPDNVLVLVCAQYHRVQVPEAAHIRV